MLLKSIGKVGVVFLMLFFVISIVKLPGTNSSFTDTATISGNTFTAGVWTTAPTDEIKKGDVVINEVMWMGSIGHDSDEWIELRNTTNHDIDLSNWYIENASSSTSGNFSIESGTISAKGYFLIANYHSSSASSNLSIDANIVNTTLELKNENNGDLALATSSHAIIDSAKGSPHWPAGCNNKAGECSAFRQSMERNDNSGSGLEATDWHTCTDAGCTGAIFWKSPNANNFGTPGAANLSGEDSVLENPTENIQNDVSGGETAVQNPSGNNGNIDNNQNNANNSGQNGPVSEKTNSGKIRKNIPVRIIGSLDIAENLKTKFKLRIKRLSLRGDFSQNKIVIDLANLGTIEKSGELKIKTSDLDLPEGVSVVSPQKNKPILLVTIKVRK